MSVLDMGRHMAESRMLDSCKITRVSGSELDEDTGEHVPVVVTVYEGRCRIKHPTTGATAADAAGQLIVVSALELHLPVTAVGVEPQDVVEVTASATRPEQVGRRFTVHGAFDGSGTTALRYRVGVADGR